MVVCSIYHRSHSSYRLIPARPSRRRAWANLQCSYNDRPHVDTVCALVALNVVWTTNVCLLSRPCFLSPIRLLVCPHFTPRPHTVSFYRLMEYLRPPLHIYTFPRPRHYLLDLCFLSGSQYHHLSRTRRLHILSVGSHIPLLPSTQYIHLVTTFYDPLHSVAVRFSVPALALSPCPPAPSVPHAPHVPHVPYLPTSCCTRDTRHAENEESACRMWVGMAES